MSDPCILHTEAALSQAVANEQAFQAIFQHAPVGIAHVSLAGRWQRANQQFCAIVGYSYDELLARTFPDITHPDDLARDLANVRQLLDGEFASYTMEKRYIRKDGSIVWVNLTVALVRTSGGVPDYFISVIEDISRRKAAEAELRFQAQLLDAVGQGVIATDATGIVRYWNRAAEQLYGWSRAEAMGRNILDLVSADVSLQQGQEIMAKLQAGERWSGVYLVRHRDGRVFPAFVTDVPLDGPDGEFIGTVGVSSDVTMQQQLEAERENLLRRERGARERAEHAAAQIAQLQDVTAALSQALTPEQVAEIIIARSADALAAATSTLRVVSQDGRTLDMLGSKGVPPDVIATWSRTPLDTAIPIAAVARNGQPLFFESPADLFAAYPHMEPIVTPLGYQAFAIVPLSVEGRTIGSLALTFTTPRAFAVEERNVLLALAGQGAQAIERARLYAAAEAAVRVRDNFIAVASHDLRSPITVLVGQAQMLARRAAQEGASERLQRSVRTIGQQASRLNRMVSSLLDLSHIQTGQITLDLRPLDLAALIRRIVEELQPTLAQHTLALEGNGTPQQVLGDEVGLEQVFYNLIGNAIKYSPSGGEVRILLAERDGQVCVEIVDQGIGIASDALPHLFERFYRASDTTSRSITGLGLGLYVVREIVTLHGGAVTASSAVGAGSTFTVCLPQV